MRKCRQRRIIPHGADVLFPHSRHGSQNHFQVFSRITEAELPLEDHIVVQQREVRPARGRKVFQPDLVFIEPFAVRLAAANIFFQFVVTDNTPLVEVSHEHLSWLEASLENRSEEHTSELQSLMRISYAVFCLKKKKQ